MSERVLTLFAIPKPFAGHVGTIQRNALRSWTALEGVQVLLLGDEDGVAAAASEAGVEHLAGLATTDAGTPRLDDAVARVEHVALGRLRCFVNADIVLLDDFLPAVRSVDAVVDAFLIVGATVDVAVAGPLDLHRPDVSRSLRERVRTEGRTRGATAIDYFVYTPGLFDPVPPFAIGRARFDNWLVWRARRRGVVVDAGAAVTAVHQHHDYGHLAGGQDEAHFGAEAARNLELAGGKRHLYTIFDASHRLDGAGRLHRRLGSTLRARETARKAAWKLRRRR